MLIEANAKAVLASIHLELGHAAEARANIQDARAMVENQYGANDSRTGHMLLAEAAVLRTIGEKRAARAAQARGEKILSVSNGAGLAATVPMQALLWE